MKYTMFRSHRTGIGRAALAVWLFFLIQTVVVNPVFCYPTSGGVNIEMCVLDFTCPCVCEHNHEVDSQGANSAWLNLCKVCMDVPIALGNDLLPVADGIQDNGASSSVIPAASAGLITLCSPGFQCPTALHPPGPSLRARSNVLRC